MSVQHGQGSSGPNARHPFLFSAIPRPHLCKPLIEQGREEMLYLLGQHKWHSGGHQWPQQWTPVDTNGNTSGQQWTAAAPAVDTSR